MVADGWRHSLPGESVMIAGRRDDVTCRTTRPGGSGHAEDLAGPEMVAAGQRFAAGGEEVIAERNHRRLGVFNGQRGPGGQRRRGAMTIPGRFKCPHWADPVAVTELLAEELIATD